MLGVLLYCTWKSTYNYYNKIVFIKEMRLSQLPKVSTRKRELHLSRGSHSSCGPSHGAQSPSTPTWAPAGHASAALGALLKSSFLSEASSGVPPHRPLGTVSVPQHRAHRTSECLSNTQISCDLGGLLHLRALERWGQTQRASQAPVEPQDRPWGAQAAGQSGAQESVRSPGL